MARYIAAKAKSPLLPTGDAHKAALFEQAASIESSNFDPFASGITAQRVFVPRRGGTTDEARVAELAKTLEGKLAGYEAILSKQKYLAGDELTLADLFHLPYGTFLAPQKFTFLEDEAKFPHVARCAPLLLLFVAHTLINHPQLVEGAHVPPVVAGSQGRRVRVEAESNMYHHLLM
jgi:glutathione S-transferase